MRNICRFIKYNFCFNLEKTFSIKYSVNDVTILKGLQTQQPYFIIQGQPIKLKITSLIKDVYEINNLPFETNQLIFYNNNHEEYHPIVPLFILIRQSFFLKYNDIMYYILKNQPLVKQIKNEQYGKTMAFPTLEPILISSLNQIDTVQRLSNRHLIDILYRAIVNQTIGYKMEKIRYGQLLKIVDQKILNYDMQIKQIHYNLEKKANHRVRLFTTFLFSQAAIIHFLIYLHFSWDIMEPITCILGNIDLFVGYYYFIIKGKQFSFEQMHKNSLQNKQKKLFHKYGFDSNKYEELLHIKKYLEYRLAFHSKNNINLMDQLSKPLMMLNSK